MSKGKRKRKQRRARQHAQQRAEQAMSLKQEEIERKSETESASERRNESTNNKNPSRKGIKSWVKENGSFTNWCLVVFTGVLALAAIYQFIILWSQLDVMRKDQRPWIKVTFDMNELKIQSPISATGHIVNGGKTPAREISAEVEIERVKNGEQPRLDYAAPHGGATTGTLFPNEPPTNFPVVKTRFGNNGSAENDIFTASESDDFMNGRIFYVIYGTIHYTDYFGTKHWTKECAFYPSPGFSGGFSAQKCTNYGDIDNN